MENILSLWQAQKLVQGAFSVYWWKFWPGLEANFEELMPRARFWGMISFNSGQNLTFFDLGLNYIYDLEWRWKTLKLVFWKLMSKASVLNTTSVLLATCVIWPLLHRYTGNAGADQIFEPRWKIFDPNLPPYKPKLTPCVRFSETRLFL